MTKRFNLNVKCHTEFAVKLFALTEVSHDINLL